MPSISRSPKDLKKWSFDHWFAFPALLLNPPENLVELKPASRWLSLEEEESVSVACNDWCKSSITYGILFFLISIDSSSHATIKRLKDYRQTCESDNDKNGEIFNMCLV